MADPFRVLGISYDIDDEALRRRYLELVRQHPPEQQPEKFAAIRAAYEQVRDLDTRLRYRLFEAGRNQTIQTLIEEVSCQTSRRRVSLEALLATERAR